MSETLSQQLVLKNGVDLIEKKINNEKSKIRMIKLKLLNWILSTESIVTSITLRNIYGFGGANSHRTVYGQGPAVQGAAAKGNACIRENVSSEVVVGIKDQG